MLLQLQDAWGIQMFNLEKTRKTEWAPKLVSGLQYAWNAVATPFVAGAKLLHAGFQERNSMSIETSEMAQKKMIYGASYLAAGALLASAPFLMASYAAGTIAAGVGLGFLHKIVQMEEGEFTPEQPVHQLDQYVYQRKPELR